MKGDKMIEKKCEVTAIQNVQPG